MSTINISFHSLLFTQFILLKLLLGIVLIDDYCNCAHGHSIIRLWSVLLANVLLSFIFNIYSSCQHNYRTLDSIIIKASAY